MSETLETRSQIERFELPRRSAMMSLTCSGGSAPSSIFSTSLAVPTRFPPDGELPGELLDQRLDLVRRDRPQLGDRVGDPLDLVGFKMLHQPRGRGLPHGHEHGGDAVGSRGASALKLWRRPPARASGREF